MSEENNNLNNEEEVVETTDTEATENTNAEAAETADTEVIEDTNAEVVETADTEVIENTDAEEGIFVFGGENGGTSVSASEKKPFPVVPVVIAAAVVVVIAAVVVVAMNWSTWFNKYNRMGYVNVSGRTVADVADASGMELDEFLEEFGLPADMPANTMESAAYYTIPCSKIAQTYGMDFETLKKTLQWDDSITEDTPWGEAEGETTLGVYVGEDGLESFKEYYGLDSSVNAETKWKEVRTAVDTKNKEDNEAQKAAMENSANDTAADETPADDNQTDEVADEAPADEAAAE